MRSGVDGAVLACENGVRHMLSSEQDSSSSSTMSLGSPSRPSRGDDAQGHGAMQLLLVLHESQQQNP